MTGKFEWVTMTKEEALAANEKHLKQALDSIYQTYIDNETSAVHRGKAIQALNSMARALGFPYLVRND